MNDTQFLLYAAKHYDNQYCLSLEDFYNDLGVFTTLKKLFTKYHLHKTVKERLVLNYLLGLMNVFDTNFVIRILLQRVQKEHYSAVKSFLLYLQRCPETITLLDGTLVILSEIKEDKKLLEILEKL